MLFVKRSEMRRDQMRKVVGQPSDNLTSVPHSYELPQVLKLETTVSRTTRTVETSTYLEVKPFPSPVDLNVAFRIKGTDAGCRALEVASVDGGSEFVFVAELDVVHKRAVSSVANSQPVFRWG